MKLSWPTVTLICVAMTIVGGLAWRGVDITAICGFILALLVGLGVAQQQQIRDQTNGQHSALLSVIEEQGRIIAASHPPANLPAPRPPAVYDAIVSGEAPPPGGPTT